MESQDGGVYTYQYGWLAPIALGFGGLLLFALGLGIRWEVRRRSSRLHYESPQNRARPSLFGRAIGALLMAGGLFVLVIGAPAARSSYVRVEPDRLVLRDSLLWFSGESRAISYSDIAAIDVSEFEQTTRGAAMYRYYLHVALHDGRTEVLEMNVLHREALERFENAWREYQRSHPRPRRRSN